MIKVLKRLGVGFDSPKGHRHYRFENETYMPLVVEQWMEGGRFMMSVSHYSYQRGDSMADPDILYQVAGDVLHPVHYQNDYLGMFQVARTYRGRDVIVDHGLTKGISDFTRTWARNIQEQYGPEDRKR
jgi:hypothetical protein